MRFVAALTVCFCCGCLTSPTAVQEAVVFEHEQHAPIEEQVLEEAETNPAQGKHLPNIVLIMVDTLRYDALGKRTPAYTKFAKESRVFRRAYAPSNWTKPSVATILTGLQPWQHNATTHKATLSTEHKLMSQYLQERGFQTTAFVSNGYISEQFGFDRGWDSFHSTAQPLQQMLPAIEAWSSTVSKDEPFFLYIHTTDCHAPYRAPRAIPKGYRGPVNFRKNPLVLNQINDGKIRLSRKDRKTLRETYFAGVAKHDRDFGKLLKLLNKNSLMENTITIFVADHGEELLEHGHVGHTPHLHEELIRVPLTIQFPDHLGSIHDEPVMSADIVPTVLELVGMGQPEYLTGRSLVTPPTDRPVFAVAQRQRTVIKDNFKLITHQKEGSRLFNLINDPKERLDLSESFPTKTDDMMRLLDAHIPPNKPRETVRKEVANEIAPLVSKQLEALGYVGSQQPQ